MKLQELRSKYYKPTPKKWRQIGDSLLLVSIFMVSSSIYLELGDWVAITSLVCGVVGKLLTNLNSE